jgi:tRNA (adenine37-N6)-methyltransferase
MTAVQLEPIGYVRSPYTSKVDTPRQPGVDDRHDEAIIELLPGMNLEQAAEELVGFDRIWVIAFFDQVGGWKPKVLTPRDRRKRSVLATRSPHRPNPIALSAVGLVGVDGLKITVRSIDLLDGTPVLDIKPYVPYADAFPDSAAGWLEEVPTRTYHIVYDEGAADDAEHAVLRHAERVLAHDPFPHPYRRTAALDDDTFELAYRQWRVRYTIDNDTIRVTSVIFLDT